LSKTSQDCLGGSGAQMKTSVIIATKDRKDDLRRAIVSALGQSVPTEIVVLDDGSTDGTSSMVCLEFPQVRLDRTGQSLGYIVQRNRGAAICSGDIIFSIDDDAEFSTPYVIEQTLLGFSDPRVAAIAIPYVEPHKSRQQFQRAPDTQAVWLTDAFRGTAYALKRQVFLDLGGYRTEFVHQGEEMDFCIRLLDRGFVVRLGSADNIIHHEFPRRDWRRMDFYGRRNDILFAWRNVPMPYLPAHLLVTTFKGIFYAVRSRRFSIMTQGLMSGYAEIISKRGCQRVSKGVYALHRLLKKRGPKRLAELESSLPPLSVLER
jgi:glycosyltransferase involved in cell wall biosynthesis